jgi:hypothetical protein
VAEAYALRQAARSLPYEDQSRNGKFFDSRKAFWTSAARSPNREDQLDLYLRAAQCFEEGGDNILAAKSYASAEHRETAVKRYCAAKAFDDALMVIKLHGTEVSHEVREDTIDLAKLEYAKTNQVQYVICC